MMERSFFQIYTPRNMYYEAVFRLKKLGNRLAFRKKQSEKTAAYQPAHAGEVGQFYDRNHDHFLAVYGDVIQAFRTKDVAGLLDYEIQSMGLQPGMRLLDAGCGVGAPAVYFARHAGVQVDAVTISEKQYETAQERILEVGLQNQVHVFCGDYHRLPELLEPGSYDGVYFLESFGHSRSKEHLINGCWDMLKPGGFLYIKDLFQKIPLVPAHKKVIEREIRKIDAAYHYEVADLNRVLTHLRGKGFMIDFIKSVALNPADFENLDISNLFQELTGIATIEDWSTYVFPVDFFEIKCIKPGFDLAERPDRHFLQNISRRHE